MRLCEATSEECFRIFRQFGEGNRTYKALQRIAQSYGVTAPTIGRKHSLLGVIRRMCDERWWRRVLRRTHGRKVEAFAIRFGLVQCYKGIYASDETVRRHDEQKRRNRQLLEELQAMNESGDTFTLQELADLSVSNPYIRRSELMARLAGFDQIAREDGYVGEFYTLTCPGRMHARQSRTDKENPRYEGTTPLEAQTYLGGQFAKIRAALDRKNIHPFGFRVCEPHHDGTPHWHLLLFMRLDDVEGVRSVFRHYALEVDSHEAGAKEHRFKAIAIDWSKGSATGYIAKYISKNIDGYGLDADLYGHEAKDSAKRIDAWAATWGIRQFQQIGGPPVGVWRELRRAAKPSGGLLAAAHTAADAGDWAAFVRAMGGIQSRRNAFPIQVVKVYSDRLGRYDEPIGDVIFGVQSGDEILVTRLHDWVITSARNNAPYGAELRLFAQLDLGGSRKNIQCIDSREAAENCARMRNFAEIAPANCARKIFLRSLSSTNSLESCQ